MTFDVAQVERLIQRYRTAKSAKSRRRIESRVLEETVWRAERAEDEECGFAAYSKEELQQLSEAVETEDEYVKMLLRRPYLKLLDT